MRRKAESIYQRRWRLLEMLHKHHQITIDQVKNSPRVDRVTSTQLERWALRSTYLVACVPRQGRRGPGATSGGTTTASCQKAPAASGACSRNTSQTAMSHHIRRASSGTVHLAWLRLRRRWHAIKA